LLALGLLLGAIALFFTTRFVSAMLHGVSAYDPSTLVGVAGTLVIVTILAAMVPALRAATMDPIEALRAESIWHYLALTALTAMFSSKWHSPVMI
jgi:putative ABC transport system permease protein